MLTIDELDDCRALLWADERSRLPADHPDHISGKARDLIYSRALARMERQCDAMIAAMLRELGDEAADDMRWPQR